jgi:hypothetical protein
MSILSAEPRLAVFSIVHGDVSRTRGWRGIIFPNRAAIDPFFCNRQAYPAEMNYYYSMRFGGQLAFNTRRLTAPASNLHLFSQAHTLLI